MSTGWVLPLSWKHRFFSSYRFLSQRGRNSGGRELEERPSSLVGSLLVSVRLANIAFFLSFFLRQLSPTPHPTQKRGGRGRNRKKERKKGCESQTERGGVGMRRRRQRPKNPDIHATTLYSRNGIPTGGGGGRKKNQNLSVAATTLVLRKFSKAQNKNMFSESCVC